MTHKPIHIIGGGLAGSEAAWQVVSARDVQGWPPYRELQRKCAAPLDISPDGFVVFDRDGRLVYTNQAFVAMTGLDLLAGGRDATLADFDREFATLGSLAAPCRPVTEALSLAINNVTDKQPPKVGNTIATTSTNGGETLPSTYDTIGRYYSIAASINASKPHASSPTNSSAPSTRPHVSIPPARSVTTSAACMPASPQLRPEHKNPTDHSSFPCRRLLQ